MIGEAIGLVSALIGLAAALISFHQVSRERRLEAQLRPQQPRGDQASRSPSDRPRAAGKVKERLAGWTALRDASIIFTVLMGTTAISSGNDRIFFLVYVVILVLGFTISAVRSPDDKRKHLTITAGTVWLGLLIVSVVTDDVDVVDMVVAAVFIALFAVVAGLISLLFKK